MAAFCRGKAVEILARIPFSRRAAEVCAEGNLIIDDHPEAAAVLNDLFHILTNRETAA